MIPCSDHPFCPLRLPLRSLLLGSLLLLVGVLAPLRADVLILHNGNEIEGRVTVRDDSYHIFIEEGKTLTVPVDTVRERRSGEAPIDRLERSLRSLPEGDLTALRERLVELAAWAENKGLNRSVREVYRRLLRVDPHHAGARDRLGYVLYRNRWALAEKLQGRGLVRFRGLWMSPDEVQQIREREAVEEFRTLLADIHNDNRYIRENAFLRLLPNRDERLLPYLKKLVTSDDGVERMLAARILGNHSFDVGGKSIYGALLGEPREQARAAMVAVLGSYGDGRLGGWCGRDLRRWADLTDGARHNLLELLRLLPHRDAVPGLIEVLEEPGWSALARRLLERLLDHEASTAAEWRAFWRTQGRRFPADLGFGWITPR